MKVLVVHSMAEWYSKAVQEGDSEHSRLSRILDVAQDLVSNVSSLHIRTAAGRNNLFLFFVVRAALAEFFLHVVVRKSYKMEC